MITKSVSDALGSFRIHTFAASAHGLCANSHLLCGPTESLLIDAQFLPAEAAEIGALIAANHPPLRRILITHGHPDHYFGLAAILQQNPGARVLATREVIDDIASTFAAKRAFWAPHYPDVLPTTPVIPDALEGSELRIDGEVVAVHSFGPAEGLHDTVAWFAKGAALFVGDLAYNQEHAWMGEMKVPQWHAAIEDCVKRYPEAARIFPGHGRPAGRELFAQTEEYLQKFTAAFEAGGGKEAIAARVIAQYPDYGIPQFVHMSVTKWLS